MWTAPGSHTSVRFTSGARPGSLSEFQLRILCFWQEGGKRNHSEILQSTLFFLTRSAFRRNCTQSRAHWGFLRT